MPLDKPIDGVSAIAVVLIASFAIDRIVTGSLFLLSFLPAWSRIFPDPKLFEDDDTVARARAQKKQKLLYFALAGLLAIPLLAWFGGVRIFSVIGFPEINPILDTIITGLILVGGSDRVAAIMRMMGGASGAAEKSEARPIEVTGKLVLEDETRKAVRGEGKKASKARAESDSSA